jgi:hypothetical protein
MPDDVPFGIGKELIVNVEINPRGIHDIYINDLIGLGLDLPDCNNIRRSERAPLLINRRFLSAHSQRRTDPPLRYGSAPQAHCRRTVERIKDDSGMEVGLLAPDDLPPPK